MYDKLVQGTQIHVKVVKRPTNVAACKTLSRVLSKDLAVRAENKRLRKVRASNYAPKPRGGRLYGGRLVKLHPVKGQLGESGTLTATHDVLLDLRRLQRFVEITPIQAGKRSQ